MTTSIPRESKITHRPENILTQLIGSTFNLRIMTEGSDESIPTATERANDDDANIQRRDKIKSATECASYNQSATVASSAEQLDVSVELEMLTRRNDNGVQLLEGAARLLYPESVKPRKFHGGEVEIRAGLRGPNK
ncbi:hypothetical protein CCHR01_07295 [Colletotrichum chrysophilum]|uniref:Uncharacterized protein n=1 Tax=Colletotrichum chrysophilum TaxID=1836956 RepID=A0AAD9AN78_9PEZI|nr:hypothetical protein CCHR01_07295 [Colletotrichum chrysophilum]